MKKVVIRELDNFRGRTEKRFQVMTRLKNRNGLNHTDFQLYDLDTAISVCKSNDWEIEAIGDFYQVV